VQYTHADEVEEYEARRKGARAGNLDASALVDANGTTASHVDPSEGNSEVMSQGSSNFSKAKVGAMKVVENNLEIKAVNRLQLSVIGGLTILAALSIATYASSAVMYRDLKLAFFRMLRISLQGRNLAGIVYDTRTMYISSRVNDSAAFVYGKALLQKRSHDLQEASNELFLGLTGGGVPPSTNPGVVASWRMPLLSIVKYFDPENGDVPSRVTFQTSFWDAIKEFGLRVGFLQAVPMEAWSDDRMQNDLSLRYIFDNGPHAISDQIFNVATAYDNEIFDMALKTILTHASIAAAFLIVLLLLELLVIRPSMKRVQTQKRGLSHIIDCIPRNAILAIKRHYFRCRAVSVFEGGGGGSSDEEDDIANQRPDHSTTTNCSESDHPMDHHHHPHHRDSQDDTPEYAPMSNPMIDVETWPMTALTSSLRRLPLPLQSSSFKKGQGPVVSFDTANPSVALIVKAVDDALPVEKEQGLGLASDAREPSPRQTAGLQSAAKVKLRKRSRIIKGNQVAPTDIETSPRQNDEWDQAHSSPPSNHGETSSHPHDHHHDHDHSDSSVDDQNKTNTEHETSNSEKEGSASSGSDESVKSARQTKSSSSNLIASAAEKGPASTSTPAPTPVDIFQKMRWRYQMGFAVLGLLAVVSFAVAYMCIQSTQYAGSELRYAGRRRYLARYLAFLAREAFLEDPATLGESQFSILSDLMASLEAFADIHRGLLYGNANWRLPGVVGRYSPHDQLLFGGVCLRPDRDCSLVPNEIQPLVSNGLVALVRTYADITRMALKKNHAFTPDGKLKSPALLALENT